MDRRNPIQNHMDIIRSAVYCDRYWNGHLDRRGDAYYGLVCVCMTQSDVRKIMECRRCVCVSFVLYSMTRNRLSDSTIHTILMFPIGRYRYNNVSLLHWTNDYFTVAWKPDNHHRQLFCALAGVKCVSGVLSTGRKLESIEHRPVRWTQ